MVQAIRLCSVDTCDRKHAGHGYCQLHLYRWRKHGDPNIIGKPTRRRGPIKPKMPCGATDCDKLAKSKGYCPRHFARWKRFGDANIPMPPRRSRGEQWSHEQWVTAFQSRFKRARNGCLEWQGNRGAHGYGRCIFEGKQWFTHRLAYMLFVGPIPDGLNVCHHCDNPPCGDPAHLFVGDNAANLADMRSKGRGYVPEAARGSDHLKTSLTERDVLRIREANAAGENQSAIARRLGISRAIVTAICNYKTWRHVGGPATPRKVQGDKSIVPLTRTGPLTEAEKTAIRTSNAMGTELARLYGVAPSTICAIRRGYVRGRPA